MAKGAASDALRESIEAHLNQTKEHVERLEAIFEALGKAARAEHCKGMEGLIEEGSKLLEEDGEAMVKDAALMGAAQRVEHYEIAARLAPLQNCSEINRLSSSCSKLSTRKRRPTKS